MARVLVKLEPADAPAQRKRRLVAEFCRLLGEQVGRPAPQGEGLPPRVRQTLERMLAGDSEKQIAGHLRVSPHTVHVYVKSLYRRYDVCSRGELLARFVRPGRATPQTPAAPGPSQPLHAPAAGTNGAAKLR
jgi:DNA-binding CsgD family transcriptional regulator